jgi:pectate lyase C
MKKTSIILLVLCIAALSVWFACNPFTQSDKSSFDVLDDSNGARLTISCTIDVNGSTYDLGGQTVTQASGNPLGDGSQQESQSPFFRITNGTVKNGTIAPPAADGNYFMGGTATFSSVSCSDIGEDYVTVKKPGTYTVSNLTANNGEDKCFQINDLCTITYQSVTNNGASKHVRQNGGKTWKCTVYSISESVQNMSECVFRSDATATTFFYRSLSTNCSRIAYDSTTKIASY